MINILSYVGMNMQSEVCLWCLLGLVRTLFDATLFKVNANLKQVWQMKMPEELSKPVQRGLRTMVSGIMLVQCFTVYVYLAAYIVLLYPVFLEERPGLVLPWLLLAAVRRLLCELSSLALGLGTCLLLGPARAPCVKFVIIKFASILPAFYVWMLVFSYYHTLKVAAAFKMFPAILPHSNNDYGLELAVRRRRTKSLLGEDQLRKKLVANFYGERTPSATDETHLRPALKTTSRVVISTDASIEEEPEADVMKPPVLGILTGLSDVGAYVYEDWFGSEIIIPRDTDRILEQLVLMLLRIGAYLKRGGVESVDSQMLNSAMSSLWHPRHNIDCSAINADATDTPPHIGSSKGNIASYLREYPQIFMKKQGTSLSQTELKFKTLNTVHNQLETNEGTTSKCKVNQKAPSTTSYEEKSSVGIEKVPSKKIITISDSTTTPDDKTVKLTLPPESQTKRTTSAEEINLKSKLKRKHGSDEKHEKYASEIVNKVLDDFYESKTSEGDFKKTSSDSKHSINSNKNKKINSTETLYEDKSKKQTHIAILSAGNSKTNAENETMNKKKDDEYTLGQIVLVEEYFIQSKQRNRADVDNETSYLTILNESTKQESATSQFVSAENINDKMSKAGTSSEKPRADSNLSKTEELSPKNAELMFKDDKNKEFPLHILSNDENVRDSLDVTKTNEDSKIKFVHSVGNNEHMHSEKVNKELPLRVLSNDDVNVSNKHSERICLHCNGECKKNEFLYKESPLRIISNDDTITNSLNVKVSSKDERKDSTDDETPNEKCCKESCCHCRKQ